VDLENVDMRSLDGVVLEDLMKLCWSNLKSLLWNHAYIDEVMKIWCCSCWTRLERVPSIWINH